MSSLATVSLEKLSISELRDRVGGLVLALDQLRAEHAALQDRAEAQQARLAALQVENQALRDEVARLKGLPPRPPLRPSGMEKATGGSSGTGSGGKRSRRRRGAKRDREAVTAEVVVKAAPPPGSRFKGYQDILVRELILRAEVVRYRRERWTTPPGETVLAPLPAGLVGGLGAGVGGFFVGGHAQGQGAAGGAEPLAGGDGPRILKAERGAA